MGAWHSFLPAGASRKWQILPRGEMFGTGMMASDRLVTGGSEAVDLLGGIVGPISLLCQ